ncbi:MAG: ATP-grasp domain-containing protein [Bacteriovoracia bacterium]
MPPKNFTIGVLGAGQLSRMLLEAAAKRSLRAAFFDEALQSPAVAARTGAQHFRGKLSDAAALRDFLGQTETVVFENEFVDCDALAATAQGLSVRFAPGLDAIRTLQDKWKQKQILNQLGIPSARAFEVRELGASPGSLDRVFKWSRQGYDGKGVLIRPRDSQRLADFIREGQSRGGIVFAEECVEFQRELALVACRTPREFKAYPLVVSGQANGICQYVVGPARDLEVPAAIEVQAKEQARALGDALDLRGCFAIEFFWSPGRLLVNEIAPRVHNSGHYTMDVCPAGQFENHLLGALGEPLGETEPTSAFFMWNLLGPIGSAGAAASSDLPPLPRAEAKLHWYDKEALRGGRKMGHIHLDLSQAVEGEGLRREFEAWDRQWAARVISH